MQDSDTWTAAGALLAVNTSEDSFVIAEVGYEKGIVIREDLGHGKLQRMATESSKLGMYQEADSEVEGGFVGD